LDFVDLHVHSTASDGTLTPSGVVCLAKEMNLKAMALTDHDTVMGISEAVEAGKTYGIEVIPGIEVSSSYENKEIHIVGLFVDYQNPDFLKTLARIRATRDARNEQMSQKFAEIGIDVPVSELKKAYPEAVITRAHFASYLYEKGIASSVKDAFDRWLNDRGPCFVPRYKISGDEAIKLIHSVGGIAILAHPILYHMNDKSLAQMVSQLSENGLDGIEAVYSTYSESDERQIRRLAKENNLLLSGGSDFHGANKPSIRLAVGHGNLRVPYDFL
jgi:hypothetical protein